MNKSFTLIEILVVIVVIGVLSAFILVGMSSITSSANIAKTQAFLNSINNSLLLGRMSQWKLDETGTTTTTIDSWGTNNGALTNFVFTDANSGWRTGSQCVSGGCLSLDGINDYIDCGAGSISSLNMGTGNFSLSIWIKGDTSVAYTQLITKANNIWKLAVGWEGYELCLSNRRYNLNISDGTNGNVDLQNPGNTTLLNNVWYNILVSYTHGVGWTYYLNGVTDGAVSKTNIENINSTYSLKFNMNGSNYFNGLIDDIRIYNQAISTSEINQNYFVGINKLLKNNGIALDEFNQRLVELKNNIGSVD